MKGVLFRKVGVVEMVDLEEPEPSNSDVVVDVHTAGICGSDVHATRDGGLLRTPPLVIGHEISGTYDGRHFAVNPMISCGDCAHCAAGHPHLCEERTIVGIQRAGGLAAKVAVPPSCLFELPDHVSVEAGAMVEPLAVAQHAVSLSPAETGARIGVLGAGTIGLMIAHLCSDMTDDLAVADPTENRLGYARQMGVGTTSKTLAGTFDVIFDAVGSATTHGLSLQHLNPGGTTVWVGNENPDPGFDAQMLVRIEQRIIGSAAYTPDDFAAATSKIDDRLLDWAEVRPLEEAPGVIYSLMEPEPGGPVKFLFRP